MKEILNNPYLAKAWEGYCKSLNKSGISEQALISDFLYKMLKLKGII